MAQQHKKTVYLKDGNTLITNDVLMFEDMRVLFIDDSRQQQDIFIFDISRIL